MFLNLVRGRPSELPPPIDSMENQWSPPERAAVEERMRYALIGSAATIRARLEEILERNRRGRNHRDGPNLRSRRAAALIRNRRAIFREFGGLTSSCFTARPAVAVVVLRRA